MTYDEIGLGNLKHNKILPYMKVGIYIIYVRVSLYSSAAGLEIYIKVVNPLCLYDFVYICIVLLKVFVFINKHKLYNKKKIQGNILLSLYK